MAVAGLFRQRLSSELDTRFGTTSTSNGRPIEGLPAHRKGCGASGSTRPTGTTTTRTRMNRPSCSTCGNLPGPGTPMGTPSPTPNDKDRSLHGLRRTSVSIAPRISRPWCAPRRHRATPKDLLDGAGRNATGDRFLIRSGSDPYSEGHVGAVLRRYRFAARAKYRILRSSSRDLRGGVSAALILRLLAGLVHGRARPDARAGGGQAASGFPVPTSASASPRDRPAMSSTT